MLVARPREGHQGYLAIQKAGKCYTRQASMKTRSEFGEYLTKHGLTRFGAEVGVSKGRNARCILDTWPGYLFLVDSWKYIDGYEDIANVYDAQHELNYQT